jgi:hypothetical protein
MKIQIQRCVACVHTSRRVWIQLFNIKSYTCTSTCHTVTMVTTLGTSSRPLRAANPDRPTGVKSTGTSINFKESCSITQHSRAHTIARRHSNAVPTLAAVRGLGVESLNRLEIEIDDGRTLNRREGLDDLLAEWASAPAVTQPALGLAEDALNGI